MNELGRHCHLKNKRNDDDKAVESSLHFDEKGSYKKITAV